MAAAQVVFELDHRNEWDYRIAHPCAVITSTYLSWMLYAYVLDKIFVFVTVVYDVL